ncbi:ATP-dependent DNA helicase RecG [Leucobacter sp. CSA1]|uniref:Probable DNA 3'-5' helicase RecG n=1 Tax=Leucobacter chromiisoli TaxID=2796471 RepID=A0A934UUT7_9MICO|nr:ATP-dependent DNA helicase RecG [Leucobacter chromiisoli]MBK0418262.1 ATP-dependent DNA helicase RecG [Leucobacter chromiisoli]
MNGAGHGTRPNEGFERNLSSIVGGRTAKGLERAFGIVTVRDLLYHFPRRYSNRGELTPLVGLPVGEHITVLAQVLDARERTMQRKRGSILEVRITDGTGTLALTFFNQRWRAAHLLPGRRGIFAGKVSEYRGQLQLQHPDYELFEEHEAAADPSAGAEVSARKSEDLDRAAARAYAERPVPIYPATAQFPSWTIEKAVGLALDALGPVEDPLPRSIREREGVFALGPSLELIHRPERTADWRKARDSMRFREAFELQLALLDRRRRTGLAESTPRPQRSGGLLDRFDAALPFELTGDQREACATIGAELARPHPMHRLLQGEVGSGKTLVALRAMLQTAESGGQSAMLAPTEVLAAQHYRSITETLGPDLAPEFVPVLLTSKMPAAERRRALLSIASGNSRVVVGTHALLGDKVTFYDLGLIVVDEQHRFGVEQRETLRQKGAQPHVLTMTATPIPRTVALTAFGDLEVSTIRELPPGRQGIETFAVPVLERPKWAERAWLRAAEEVGKGRQVYVVCPAISAGAREDGDAEATEGAEGPGAADAGGPDRPLASVEQTVAELRARPDYAGLRVEGLSGSMRPEQKDAVMQAFAAGEIAILVATTVIEVGVNVPNASMMIVRDADRFGISQLHQLRGRVGRGEHPGLCLLLTAAEQGSVARERIEAVAATGDGFALAEADLELRREGDILGTAQSGGRSTLRLLRVAEHGELIAHAREVAAELLEQDPTLEGAPGLWDLLRRENESGHLENLAKS